LGVAASTVGQFRAPQIKLEVDFMLMLSTPG